MVARTQRDLRVRKNFAKVPKIIDIPDLISIQRSSYEKFLQSNVSPEKREDVGIQGIFKSVFPIRDFNKTAELEFVSYHLEPPKYDTDECRQRGMTFAAPIKVAIRLVTWDTDEAGNQSIRDMKEQEVYFGEIPLMTDHGTFIINGTERVIVSQLHRSPGVFFNHDRGKTHSSGKLLYSARIIPYRGSWIDFEFDHKDLLYVRIDRRRKMHATVLLRALGFTAEELLNIFYKTEVIRITPDHKFFRQIDYDLIQGQKVNQDIIDPASGQVVVRKGKKLGRANIRRLKETGITELEVNEEEIYGKVFSTDVINLETGEVLFDCNDEIDSETVVTLTEAGVEEFEVLFIDPLNAGPFLRDTLKQDKITSADEAILEIYRRLRPGDPSTVQQARTYFNNLFFNASRYDLSEVGRVKMNHKLHNDHITDETILTKEDIVQTVGYLIELRNGRAGFNIDDIDHLGNRRVRAVGELMENQYRIGLVRMERAIKERMSMSQELETLMPHDLINAKPVSAVVKEYFGSSQLSQFMDQTNPLSEVTHKRRLSALGPGGLTRDRAGFEVRDVHTTHYGRVCPIETPEGPNIGLIASLATYARVNRLGFIETPYRKVEDKRVTNEVRYYSALEERNHIIAQANANVDANGTFSEELVPAREHGEFAMVPADKVTLMDVSTNQLVSVAASLVPFLQNDDANRALMGANMMRQAVPLLRTTAPLVGTSLEPIVAADSGVTVVAKNDGIVEQVDAERIVVKPDALDTDIHTAPDIYRLVKYQRSNQNTCINQKPIVRAGDRVKAGAVIADGPATELGELALGRNVVVAFMPWGGYNFEDSILISEKVVKEDLYTSIHIEEFECTARDTKLGKEEITRDIPNVGEEAMANLDEAGIVRIGAEVKTGDILVGKITPKGESQLSPEEKLLRAIFGEKAGDVRDTSLRMPPGVKGTVIEAQVFSRKGVEKDSRSEANEQAEESRLRKDMNDETKIMRRAAYSRIARLLDGAITAHKLVSDSGEVLIGKGVALSPDQLEGAVPQKYWRDIRIEDGDRLEQTIKKIIDELEGSVLEVETRFEDKIDRLKKGDELPPGVIKMVKVYVAIKRKLQVGDKMAGRHGNKGVISRILPEEDLPYLPDGTPVDVVLNPLGVPSRMNVGQILETHLGWAALGLGQAIGHMVEDAASPSKVRSYIAAVYDDSISGEVVNSLSDDDVMRLGWMLRFGMHVATPVFDGATEPEIRDLLEKAGRMRSGQTVLFDGRTGEAFDEDVTVGVMYMLKLHHLVDDKIHARSIGPYSLVTQQPLGGKAQFGGQRLGEMEVWAMEAYGSAYGLQEFLTVKSDDVVGRTRVYEAIVKGEHTLEPGLPESFKVLLKELKALALDVELIEAN
ncbi:MAG: DNA-directed RNA polymerase subunit beta [Deltaproteobacteria bacterium HGW-Deltaproteobacteria-14]|nr:MAG: DNA-directed RNA polymerase subunit beta [Deltaproteobacteria bacterium HGW-Deltaproteobacteria-14]